MKIQVKLLKDRILLHYKTYQGCFEDQNMIKDYIILKNVIVHLNQKKN